MRKLIPLALFIFLISIPLSAAPSMAVEPQDIVTDIYTISKLFPRTEGSEGETALLDIIIDRLTKLEIQYNEDPFSDPRGYHSFSKIISAEIPGTTEEFLTLIVPLNPPTADLETGSVNIALALGLLENYSQIHSSQGLRVVFMGGEFDEVTGKALGTQHFLSNFTSLGISPIFYLNFSHIPKNILIKTDGREVLSPRWLIESTAESLEKTFLSSSIKGDEAQYARLGLGNRNTLIEPYLSEGYPAILFEGDGRLEEGEWTLWIETMMDFFNNFLEANSEGFPEDEDTHYLFFQFQGRFIIIPEFYYILSLIVILGLILLYPFFARRRFKRYARMVRHHLWILPVMVIIIFILLFLGTMVVEALLKVKDFPNLWEENPFPFYFMKIVGALVVFSFAFKLFKLLPFSKKGNFYSAAALQLIIIDLLVISFINISFSYYILWSLIFVFLFTTFRSRILKIISLLISMFWIFTFIYDIFTIPKMEIIRILLLSRIWGNLVQALILLPFIFLIIRLSYLFYIPKKSLRKALNRTALAMLTALYGVLILYLGLYDPHGSGKLQSIEISDSISMVSSERDIKAFSPAPIPIMEVTYEGQPLTVVEAGRTAVLSSKNNPIEPTIKINERYFLNRRAVEIIIEEGDIQSDLITVSLHLNSPKELIILDANFPYTMEGLSGGGAIVHIGSHPNLPLLISLIVPDDLELNAKLIMTQNLAKEEYQIEKRNFSIQGKRSFITEIPIIPQRIDG